MMLGSFALTALLLSQTLPRSATDLAYLNKAAAGANGPLTNKSGALCESTTGRRVKIYGLKLAPNQIFIEHAAADKLADDLSKSGYNAVWLSGFDLPDRGALGIWERKGSVYGKFDAGQMDKLDYLLSALKTKGIYYGFTLLSKRSFEVSSGFPESAKSATTRSFSQFLPRAVLLQKDFARQLLTHVNPYTKSPLGSDPACFAIQIQDGTVLSDDMEKGYFGQIPEDLCFGLKSDWNEWLKTKYRTHSKLNAAWIGSAKPLGKSLLPECNEPNAWQLGSGKLFITPNMEGFRVDVLEKGKPEDAWIKSSPVATPAGKSYTLTFQARADRERTMTAVAGGQREIIGLDATWREYVWVFTSSDPTAGAVIFQLGSEYGGVLVRSLKLQEGAPPYELAEDENLDNGSITFPTKPLGAVQTDWQQFLGDKEMFFFREMRRFIREELKCTANITGAPGNAGRKTQPYREGSMDMATGNAANPPLAAQSRIISKPFLAFSDVVNERLPIVTTLTAAQDWDGVIWSGTDSNFRNTWAATTLRIGAVQPVLSTTLLNLPVQFNPGNQPSFANLPDPFQFRTGALIAGNPGVVVPEVPVKLKIDKGRISLESARTFLIEQDPNQTVSLPSWFKVEGEKATGFRRFAAVAMDAMPLAQSKRVLFFAEVERPLKVILNITKGGITPLDPSGFPMPASIPQITGMPLVIPIQGGKLEAFEVRQ